MFRTLFSRLAAALVALSLALSVTLALVLESTHRSFHLEIEQRQHRRLAERLVARIGNGEAGLDATFEQIRMLELLNPEVAAYVLKADGTVIASSLASAGIKRPKVSIAPILAFLQGPAAWPLLGDDPATERGQALFSAARMGPPLPGRILYVVLGSAQTELSAVAAGDRSYSLREALWLTLANVAIAFIAALVAAAIVVHPVTRLRRAMETFNASRFAAGTRYHAGPGRSVRHEVDRLGEIFDSMADRISTQIESLQRSDEARRELYAGISHDLQTPVTALHGYVETLTLKDGALSPVQRMHYLEILNRQTMQLGELIDQVTDLARLEMPELRLQLQDIRSEELLQHVIDDLRPLIEEKGLTMEWTTVAPLPSVKGDADLLRRALANVLLNAVQITPRDGTIGIQVTASADETLDVTVTDTGPGMRGEEIQRLFEPGYRSSPAVRRGSPGMGLGLAIARKVVELHGGTLSASNVGRGGAAFRITLPTQRAPA